MQAGPEVTVTIEWLLDVIEVHFDPKSALCNI